MGCARCECGCEWVCRPYRVFTTAGKYLRLLALNGLRAALAFFVAVVGRRLARSTALPEQLNVPSVQVDDLGRFGIHVDVRCRVFAGVRQQFLEGGHDRFVEASVGREIHREQNIKVSLNEGIPVAGHALVGDDLDKGPSVGGLGLDDLSGFRSDNQIPSVEVLDLPLESAEGLVQ